MSNEFKRTPTHGENDVDLRVATEPRRVTDAVLSQIIAAKAGEIATLTAEVTHLAEKLAERNAKSADRNADFHGFDIDKLPAILISCVAKLWPGSQGLFWETFLERMPTRIEEWKAVVAPQPVEVAQAVPEELTEKQALVVSCMDAWANDAGLPTYSAISTAAQPAAQGAVPVIVAALGALGLGNPHQIVEAAEHIAAALAAAPVAQPTDTTRGA